MEIASNDGVSDSGREEPGSVRFAIARASREIGSLTAAALGLLAGLTGLFVVLGLRELPAVNGVYWSVAGLIAVGSAALVLGTWRYGRPSAFVLTDEALRIQWPGRSREIPWADVLDAREISKRELGMVLRWCGVGGLFGAFGLFYAHKVGNLDIYATRSDGLVLLARRGRRGLLITPDRPAEFVSRVSSRIAKA